MVLSLECLTSLYLMLYHIYNKYNYSYIQCILVTTHLDCLRRTIRNTLITIEITNPTKEIANNVGKARSLHHYLSFHHYGGNVLIIPVEKIIFSI